MVARGNGLMFRQIHDLFGGGTISAMDEGRLLERFVTRNDAAAFEGIVARFGPMVLGVCRRLLHDPRDVEDAFQATFVVLIRRAATIRDRELVGNWLYGVAYRVATRARANARRRQRREVAWVEEQAMAPPEPHANERLDLRQVLDEELSRLPEKYRQPVCLCYVQDQSYEEAARRLKCPIGTVRSRLAKARELMRSRLVRRGIALPAAVFAEALRPNFASAAVPPTLFESTVANATGLFAAKAIEAGGVRALAESVIRSMVLGKLKSTVALVLAASIAASGSWAAIRVLGIPKPVIAAHDDRAASNETARANPPAARVGGEAERLSRIDRFVEELKKHPARPSSAPERSGLYVLDVDRGDVTLIAGEPAIGLTHCGSACWSGDGIQIVFDATPKAEWNLTQIHSVSLTDDHLERLALGPGNCPSTSPDGRQIAFILNSGAVPGAQYGIWLMNADGSGRRRLGRYGRIKWAPDENRILSIVFTVPPKATSLALVDVETADETALTLPDYKIFSVPSWAGKGLLAAVLGQGDFADRIALLDVTDPNAVTVKEVLWKQGSGPPLEPSYPLYSQATKRCIFVGTLRNSPALYAVERGQSAPPRRLAPGESARTYTDLSASPDGRYVVFCGDYRPAKER
jgi:RNA polymerase sigma factor (sigma-70 family)